MSRLVGYLGQQDANAILHQCMDSPDMDEVEDLDKTQQGFLACIGKGNPVLNKRLSKVNKHVNVRDRAVRRTGKNLRMSRDNNSSCFILDQQGKVLQMNYPLKFGDESLDREIEATYHANVGFLKKIAGLEQETEAMELAMLYRKYFSMVIFNHQPEKRIVAIRHGGQPLIVGFKDDGILISSDTSDILDFTNDYRVVEDKEIVVLSKEGARFISLKGRPVRRILYGLKENSLCARVLAMDSASYQPAV